MQVLNIVVPEARILASRERCPYLVRMEVVETGLEGSDARLYAAGAPKLGVTVEEALKSRASSDAVDEGGECNIPLELLPEKSTEFAANSGRGRTDADTFPRGGSTDETDFMHGNPYEAFREGEYEQLHHHMHSTQVAPIPQQDQVVER